MSKAKIEGEALEQTTHNYQDAHNHPENGPECDDAVTVAQEALADTPYYVQHIINTLTSCVWSFRSGADTEAMTSFSRAMDDLDQFVQLYWRIAHEAQVAPDGVSEAFKCQIRDCIARLDMALAKQDIEALSSGIEAQLIPLLPAWIPVAMELQEGLDQRQETANA